MLSACERVLPHPGECSLFFGSVNIFSGGVGEGMGEDAYSALSYHVRPSAVLSPQCHVFNGRGGFFPTPEGLLQKMVSS